MALLPLLAGILSFWLFVLFGPSGFIFAKPRNVGDRVPAWPFCKSGLGFTL